jgi:hypothetical protein
MIRRILWSFQLVVVTVACSGCSCGCHSGYVSDKTPQGKELKAILDEKRDVGTEPPQGMPLKFDPVKIDVQHEDKENFYRAVLIWRRTDAPPPASDPANRDQQIGRETKLNDAIRRILIDKVHEKRNDLEGGDATGFKLFLQFKDKSGKVIDTESVSLKSNDFTQDSGTLYPKNVGKSGAPHSAIAELESVDWQESALPTVNLPNDWKAVSPFDPFTGTKFDAIGDLPLDFKVVMPTGDTQLMLDWTVSDRQALNSMLIAQNKTPDAKIDLRRRLTLTCKVIYRNERTLDVASEDFTLLIGPEDEAIAHRLPLKQKITAGTPAPASIVIELKSASWEQRFVQVQMR